MFRRLTLTPLLLLLPLLCVLPAQARVLSGLEVLRADNFAPLRGKRVGLVTNPTGVDSRLRTTIDILHAAPGVTLAALFAPEHGVRGDVPAGAKVPPAVDPATGVKVHSLYGSVRKPTPAMLRGIDVMVYDIQDIGCRSYTFISTLGKIMEACIENDVPLIILDRPNPLGGNRIEGPMEVDPDCRSFVSQYSIPYVYGLTPGELARYLNSAEFGSRCRLSVIPMQGWTRSMTFDRTGLPWVPTSPNIPTAETALFYPATGILGELGVIAIGANFTMPFRLAVGESVNAERLAADLTALSLPGVLWRPCHVKISGSQLHGVQLFITDPDSVSLTPLQFFIMQALSSQDIDVLQLAQPARLSMFDKVCGSKSLRRAFARRHDAADVLPLLTAPADSWRKKVTPFLLYD